jgi:hypothetical protein
MERQRSQTERQGPNWLSLLFFHMLKDQRSFICLPVDYRTVASLHQRIADPNCGDAYRYTLT